MLQGGLLLVALFGVVAARNHQAISVSGNLMCGSEHVRGATVKLIEEDHGGIIEILDEGYTDNQGKFTLRGTKTDITPLDAYIVVYTTCNAERGRNEERKIFFSIPLDYVSGGSVARKVFDIGVPNLEAKFTKEEERNTGRPNRYDRERDNNRHQSGRRFQQDTDWF